MFEIADNVLTTLFYVSIVFNIGLTTAFYLKFKARKKK
jgi:hypothetical protein